MKVNVLGTEYKIITDDSIIQDGADGICKSYDKKILIRSKGEMLCSDDSAIVKAVRHKEVLRHELVHAFFEESGLDDYSNNEQLVIWMAAQFPKMLKAFIEADCVGLSGIKYESESEPYADKIKQHMKGGAKCLQ